jgi:transposase-like protein
MPMAQPVGGRDFPRTSTEIKQWFPTQVECLDYLEWLRWPDGIECRACVAPDGWHTGRGDWLCASCGNRTSILAGTIFERTRVRLPQWFELAWRMTSEKTAGISAKGAQRLLSLGSYQTAWTMLHKLRCAMVRPGRDLLQGEVEVDETFVGGKKAGKPGRGAAGKAMVCIAVEVKSPMGFGRARLQVIPDAKRSTLHQFVRANVAPGAVVLTDGLVSYKGLDDLGYVHKPFVVDGSGVHAHVPLPGVHRVASLFKRSLLNSYQSYPQLHLQSYCDEWAFRFNRRKSEHRGQLFLRLLENAVLVDPVTYHDIAVGGQPSRKAVPRPARPGTARQPAVETAERPWRQ